MLPNLYSACTISIRLSLNEQQRQKRKIDQRQKRKIDQSESSLNAKDRNSVFHAKDRNKSRERQRLVRHCLHNRRGQFRTNSVGLGQIHFVLYLLVFSAQGPWVILFSRYRGSSLISCPSVVFASAQSASGELSGLISTVFYCW